MQCKNALPAACQSTSLHGMQQFLTPSSGRLMPKDSKAGAMSDYRISVIYRNFLRHENNREMGGNLLSALVGNSHLCKVLDFFFFFFCASMFGAEAKYSS